MTRDVAGSRPLLRNEDWAIATIQPLPGNVLIFQDVRAVLDDFFAEVVRVQIISIQRTHLGQALIKFARVPDRDSLVLNSPHQFGNILISFVRHNQGRNWRRFFFNREVWLMLLGFPCDYVEEKYIDIALSPFGRMISWHSDPDYKASLLVRARVVDLESVLHFIVFSEIEGLEGDSWTIQCEVVQQELLGVGPLDEE